MLSDSSRHEVSGVIRISTPRFGGPVRPLKYVSCLHQLSLLFFFYSFTFPFKYKVKLRRSCVAVLRAYDSVAIILILGM